MTDATATELLNRRFAIQKQGELLDDKYRSQFATALSTPQACTLLSSWAPVAAADRTPSHFPDTEDEMVVVALSYGQVTNQGRLNYLANVFRRQ